MLYQVVYVCVCMCMYVAFMFYTCKNRQLHACISHMSLQIKFLPLKPVAMVQMDTEVSTSAAMGALQVHTYMHICIFCMHMAFVHNNIQFRNESRFLCCSDSIL